MKVALGWKKYYTAIGIRADEIDRINPNYQKLRILYPFIKLSPQSKPMVNDWWKRQDFDLRVPDGFGNCNFCWKKGIKTLSKNIAVDPEGFQWWKNMTEKYGHLQPRKQTQKMKPPFNFYRGNLSPKELIRISKFDQTQMDLFSTIEKLDGCSESCEPF